MRIVLDTNVLVSALLTHAGKPWRILALVFAGGLTVLYDDRILSEYGEVLGRKNFHFDASEVQSVLNYIERAGERVVAEHAQVVMRDPSDIPFLEVAITGQAEVLVTGNRRDFPEPCAVPILSPAELLERLERPERAEKPEEPPS